MEMEKPYYPLFWGVEVGYGNIAQKKTVSRRRLRHPINQGKEGKSASCALRLTLIWDLYWYGSALLDHN